MLSIITYGRNDTHGYNLHKRAAISLNCMAAVLRAPDDEILFVDYNSPDDLPTFPEAIQDTLTAETKRRLRVLRIRPEHHAPLRYHTHLVALESRSRNAAVRRANPANRWVLSTNPDMVFVPRGAPRPLTEVVAGLEDGCYHLPRFEIPETLWEAYDRMDPAGIIAQLARQGRRLHLNDVVYGSEAALFDGHGDFQLLLRADLEAISGFHEQMIHGWHVDSNLAKRILLLRGEVRSLLDHYYGYHCDHTRMASIGHGRDRLENDLRRFYDDVTSPYLPEQADDWGLAGVELEEIRLAQGLPSPIVAAIEAALPEMETDFTEAAYVAATADDPRYPAEHVLPYLCDLLVTQRRDRRLGWFGGRASMLRMTVRAMAELGFVHPIAVGEGCAAGLGAVSGVAVLPDDQVLEQADLFVFEFGAASQDGGPCDHRWRDDDLNRLRPVADAFDRLAEIERHRLRQGADGRRVIALNAIHNRFEVMVNDRLSVNRTPFSSHLRQGFVLPGPGYAEPPSRSPLALCGWLTQAMGRRQRVPVTEAVRLTSNLHELLHAQPSAPRLNNILQSAAPLLALLDHPGLAADEEPAALDALRQRLWQQRYSVALAPRLQVPMVAALPSRSQAPCRLATTEDWEDDDFIALARRHYNGMFAANILVRTRPAWNCLSVLAGLGDRGSVPGRAAVIATEKAHPLAAQLRAHDWGVDVVARAEEFGRDGDLVVFTERTLFFGRPPEDAAADLARAAAKLRSGGMVVVIDSVPLDGVVDDGEFNAALACGDAFAEAARVCLGLERLPAAPAAVTALTLDRTAFTDAERRLFHFVSVEDGRLWLSGTWFLIKTGEAVAGGADAFARAIRAANRASACCR
ncbi:MAG: hypothetical protein FD176_1159 [Rhodospirillaceae bacterium]|nr:MAG: hypothetical protein FD176_1159 [Rhodospirillaceae bacterium]TNC96668.1 MAG: hypothetical protein FD119_1553 [Stygiobacter sp.]